MARELDGNRSSCYICMKAVSDRGYPVKPVSRKYKVPVKVERQGCRMAEVDDVCR